MKKSFVAVICVILALGCSISVVFFTYRNLGTGSIEAGEPLTLSPQEESSIAAQNAAEQPSENEATIAKGAYSPGEIRDMGNNGKSSFVLGFTGDINFTPTGYVMTKARNYENGPLDLIDEVFINEMQSADIMLINNEFPYSDRGERQEDKKYTFRSEPENINYLLKMGVDIVALANNHTYDYGYDAFVDTLKTVDEAGIARVGAGMNYEEAATPAVFSINGKTVAYFAGSGVEYPIKTPVATKDSCGIMGTYDDGEKLCEEIAKAKDKYDYIIVFPHWGWENTTELTNAQRVNAKKYIDYGASAVIGCHSHCLQGMEFYKGAPIAYSLGNFWFNTKDVYTALLKLTVSDDGIIVSLVPGRQRNSETRYLTSESERRELYDNIEKWSPEGDVSIDDNGVVREK